MSKHVDTVNNYTLVKNKNGITLIALVVTIIILLILAGISISALTQIGLFGKTKQAEQKSKDAQELENLTLADYENKIDSSLNGSRDTVTISKEEYEQIKLDLENLKNTSCTIETGTYIGTGKAGESNPNKLEFSKAPKLIIISTSDIDKNGNAASLVLTQGNKYSGFSSYSHANLTTPGQSLLANRTIWLDDGKKVEWYTSDVENQMNGLNIKYSYIVLY